jgi:hypothetical protein
MKRNGLTRESHDSQMIFSQKPLNRRFYFNYLILFYLEYFNFNRG